MSIKAIHSNLVSSSKGYASWHKHRGHSVTHWSAFVLVSLLATVVIIDQVDQTYAAQSSSIPKVIYSASRSDAKVVKYQEPLQSHVLFRFKSDVSKSTQSKILAKEGITVVRKSEALGFTVGKISENDTPEEVVQRLIVLEKDYIDTATVDYTLSSLKK